MRHVIGISAYYHDSTAALLSIGALVAAAQEVSFIRKKNAERLPRHAVAFCINKAGLREADRDAVVFCDKPTGEGLLQLDLQPAKTSSLHLAMNNRGFKRMFRSELYLRFGWAATILSSSSRAKGTSG